MLKTGIGIAVAMAVAGVAADAQGAIIFGNMDGVTSYSGTASTIDPTASKAIGFRLSESYDVSSLKLMLKDTVYTLSSTSNVLPRIYTQTTSGSYVGSLVGSFTPDTVATFTTTAASYSFTPASSIRLSADTDYWIFLIGSGDGFTWCNSSPTVAPTGVDATLTGARYASTAAQPTLAGGTSGNYNSFQLEGQIVAVPEPGMAGVVAAGLCGISMLRRRAKIA